MSAEVVFGGDSVDIPAGTYPAKLKSIEVKTSGQYGEFRAWDFELDSGSIVGGASSMSMSSKSKGGRWAIALAGRTPKKGETIDLAGRSCLVSVEEDADGWPKVVNVVPAPAATAKAPWTAESGKGVQMTAKPPLEAVSGDPDELPF